MYLGLDFGTSGARACVVDDNRSITWEQSIAYLNPAEQTPLDWRTALNSLLTAMPKSIAGQLRGLAIDGTSGTVLLCDKDLNPVTPALLYHDDRAHQQASQLTAIAPKGHIVCTATSGLAKFLWLTAPRPSTGRVSGGGVNAASSLLDSRLPTFGVPLTGAQQNDFKPAAYFLHQADWLTALLSGQPGISDYHNALKTGYDIDRLCWPDWIMTLPHAHLLPQVFTPGENIGYIQPDIAAHFGIHPQCAIHAGTTDSIAAFIATEINEIGVGITSLGSTLVLKQLSPTRIDAPEFGVYSHRYADLWLVGGASNAGGCVLRRYFDDAQLAALSAHIDPLQTSPLDYYPLSKTGERFPVNDAHLAPRMEPRLLRPGSGQAESDVEFLHGLLQGLARIEAAGYAKLAALDAPPLSRVITNGGGAKNTVWCQMRERLLGVPVSTALHTQAAYGSALLCTRNG